MTPRYSFLAALGLACLASSALLLRLDRPARALSRRLAYDEPLGLGA